MDVLHKPYDVLDLRPDDCPTKSRLFCSAHYKRFCIGWTSWKSSPTAVGWAAQWLAVDHSGTESQYHMWHVPPQEPGEYTTPDYKAEGVFFLLNLGSVFEVNMELTDLHAEYSLRHPLDLNPIANALKKKSFERFMDYLDRLEAK